MKVFLKNYITVGLLPPVGGENAKKDHPARPAGHTRAVPFSHFPRFFQILFSQDLHNILMHQMLNSLLIQSLDNLNCHADGAFYIFDSTEIIVAVYITAWNAKFLLIDPEFCLVPFSCFSCKADLACVGAAASSYCVLVGDTHGIAQFMCIL